MLAALMKEQVKTGSAGKGQHSQGLLRHEYILWQRQRGSERLKEREKKNQVLFDAKGLTKNQVAKRNRDAFAILQRTSAE